jgi:hypothetical protein
MAPASALTAADIDHPTYLHARTRAIRVGGEHLFHGSSIPEQADHVGGAGRNITMTITAVSSIIASNSFLPLKRYEYGWRGG